MNLLVLAVLGALAWFSFENGMEFFGALVILAGVLLLFTEKPRGRGYYREAQDSTGQPVIIDQGGAPPSKKELRLKVKNWKDRWDDHPNEYVFYHVGLAFNNIGRSLLYILGIEKDEK